MGDKERLIKQAVKEHYAGYVKQGSSCCDVGGCELDKIGGVNYNEQELAGIPQEAVSNSFGCGNPLAFAGIKEGDTVVDIGSGAGLDAILAAKAVGVSGIVIGVDMTPEMIRQAEENVRQAGLQNVTFIFGEAENLPLEQETADWVISNCVINLSPNKQQVFQEIFRILKPGGSFLISDMVAENLPVEMDEDLTAWCNCITGAIPEKEYLNIVEKAGFVHVEVVDRVEHKLSGLTDIKNVSVASIRLSAFKPIV